MKQIYILMIIVILSASAALGQVAINSDNSAPDPSAMLDVKSINKGLLPPRVALSSTSSAAPVTAPAIGLLVYNTATAGTPPNNVVPGNYYWNGTRWMTVSLPSGANAGDMLYWNGSQWVMVPVGNNGQNLTLNNTVPTWGGSQLPIISTVLVTGITTTTATSGGNITSDGGAPVTARGVCWSTSPNPTNSNNLTNDGSATGAFASTLSGLPANTLYYVRAYATNSVGTSYGNQLSFTTLSFTLGQSFGGGIIFYIDGTGQSGLISSAGDLSTGAPWGCKGTLIGGTGTAIGTGQSNTTAIVNGCSTSGIAAQMCNDLMLDGYSDWYLPSKDELNQMYLQKSLIGGFASFNYWSSSESDANNAWYQNLGTGYQGNGGGAGKAGGGYVRAIRAFSATATVPAVSTTAITNIAQISATGGGNVTSDGGAPVSARGTCWSTNQNPTLANSYTTDGNGTGTFASNLSGLAANTLYFARAYATNSSGTSYGNQVSFTTISFSIGQSYGGGVIFYIDITGQNGLISAISDQSTGAQWGCSGTSIGGTSTAIGKGQANTTAIVNGCSTTGIAARICNDLVLNGYNDWFLPSKDELNQMFVNRVAIGGFGDNVYWSSSQYDGSNAWAEDFQTSYPPYGQKYSATKSASYYVRAIRAFSPAITLPTISTTEITNITHNSATGGGNATSNGGSPVTARGVCWSTTLNPTISDSHTTDSTGTGEFESQIMGLFPNTHYVSRAYGSNLAGTTYGKNMTWTTHPWCFESITVNHVTSGGVAPVNKTATYTSVGNIPGEEDKCWITSNLGASHEAYSMDDATEASAGWYWQFNRKQGYKHDGTTRTPNTLWTPNINENLDWQAANDPCTLEMGNPWRMPTYSEWENVKAALWNAFLNNGTTPYSSGLKLHFAGFLSESDGSLHDRGVIIGMYWTTEMGFMGGNQEGTGITVSPSQIGSFHFEKANGFTIRCLRNPFGQ